MNLDKSIPFYTTRKHGADNETATYSQPIWITFLVIWAVELNIILWSGYGLFELGRLVVGA